MKVLIIQTAFIGDVVLATALAEKIHQHHPSAILHFLVRKGNESLLTHHPFIEQVWVWDKKKNKNRNLFSMAMKLRKELFTHVINPHRFTSSGLISYLTGAPFRSGFDKNPLSRFYTNKVKHIISEPYSEPPIHEIQRNQLLIEPFTDALPAAPKLYPSQKDYQHIFSFQTTPYICIAPSSVWFTKQFPAHKWVALMHELKTRYTIYLIGGKGDEYDHAQNILQQCNTDRVQNLCGQLSFLQSAALMQGAVMNYTNDSAPLHFCSAMNAPVTAVFCSTVPAFGFTPIHENGRVVEVAERLACRPCGLHGKAQCPLQHFNCAEKIETQQLLWWI